VPCARRRQFAQRFAPCRAPTTDELILQYKGLLGSTSDYQKSALGNFQKHFDRLKRQKKADR
jgi:hypothetical protein